MRQSTLTARCFAVALAAAELAGCQRQAETPTKGRAPAAAKPQIPQIPPLPAPVLGRSDLLQLLAAAGSAYAAQRLQNQEGLAGRRFSVRQAFGCPGSVEPQSGGEDGIARWSWGRGQKSIEINLRPADWSQAPVIAGPDNNWDAVEGFWLTRPWLLTEGCPRTLPAVPVPLPAAPSPQTAGLAAVFERDGSRLGRHGGKAFSFRMRGDEAPLLPSPTGYELVLEGCLVAFPDGRTIRCRSRGPDARPVCIAAVEIDRVAFEDDSGELLREWRAG